MLRTEVAAEKAYNIHQLHEISDWVITVDRNVGIEFFDSPNEDAVTYDMYVVDCIPERQDLDFLHLVTSTCRLDEIRLCLEQAIIGLQLPFHLYDAQHILKGLKALSGRLAMHLTFLQTRPHDLIALALLSAECARAPQGSEHWLPLHNGFFVPMEDVQDLLFPDSGRTSGEAGASVLAPDTALVYVDTQKGRVRLQFVQATCRPSLQSAREVALHVEMVRQARELCMQWTERYFDAGLTTSERVIRRKRLVHVLRFYLEKARRHHLRAEAYRSLRVAVEKLLASDAEVVASEEARGYIFCPEYRGLPEEVGTVDGARIVLFGLAEQSDLFRPPAEDLADTVRMESAPVPESREQESVSPPPLEDAPAGQAARMDRHDEAVRVLLGHGLHNKQETFWTISVRSNPHLMVVGQPGTGKTTSLINICIQLARSGVVPIIFAYHPDIETRLAQYLPDVECRDLSSGLGFNPMRVVSQSAHGWLDNVGMLRDILAAIFPEMGDIQTNEIRQAIKDSYVEQGYQTRDTAPRELSTPEFHRFYQILRNRPKTSPGVLARLEELDDYGLFRTSSDRFSLLQGSHPTVLRIHTTGNQVLQNAMAYFTLFNIYQDMLLRGEQPAITHAIVFDEAHRASRLRLIPQLAKECRKFGIALIVSSQAVRDFPGELFEAISSYLILRVLDDDAKALVQNVLPTEEKGKYATRIKQLRDRTALFTTANQHPRYLHLLPPEQNSPVLPEQL